MNKVDDRFPYEDIVDLPHPVAKNRARMSMIDRAAQFSPFSALSGYDAAIRETARLTEEMSLLDDDSKVILDRKLRTIMEQPVGKREAVITYFQPDDKKSGGAYVSVSGEIKKLDDALRAVYMKDGTKIAVDAIVDVEGNVLRDQAEL